ncbi:MAG: DUF1499 domain-containing protein [Shimia sp.]
MWWLWAIIGILLVLMAVVRLAPTDAAQWHEPVEGTEDRQGDGEFLAVRATQEPRDALAGIDRAARATPRTRAIAGSVEEGRVTYLSRSLVWGFPDFTTVESREGAVAAHARLRFGRKDFGANRRRLEGWLDAVGLA